MLFIRQNATHKVLIGPVVAVANGYVPVTTLDLSTADEAEAILHDNGTTVSISAYTFAAITNADGYYHLTLQSGITGTVGHMTIVINDDSLCLPVKADFTVIEEAVYDALYAASAPGYVTNQPVDVNTIKTQTVTCAAGVTVLASVGTAATSTAQTGDAFARLGAPAGASVSADVAAVKAETASILTDTAEIGAAGAGLTALVDLIWDEPTSGHTTAGTTGKALTDAGSAGDPWATALPGAYGAGTAGKIVGDNINATISSRMATYTQPTGFLAATFPATVASPTNITAASGVVLSAAGNEAAADALLNRNVSGGSNTGRTVKQAYHFIRNKWVVAAGTLTVYDTDDTTSSWTAAVTGTTGADPVTGSDPA
jgi:hypothetical protein